jgi:glycosyltransferase involved in cell wall biosynthesis
MRVFDTRWIGSHGIGRFALELRNRLAGFSPVGIPGKPSDPLDPLKLRKHLMQLRPELYFSPGYNVPLGNPCPFAFCIHDLNHMYVKANSSLMKRSYYRILVQPAIRRAVAVLTVSEFSRQIICEWADVDPESVVNVGNGVSEVFRPEGSRFHLEQPYLLHVGNYRPHKNFERTLEAFAASGLASEIVLLCTGAPAAQLCGLIGQLGLAERVHFAGKVTDDELAALYRGALGLVFASCYEGFGLPIVEAMACGTPVLTSSTTAMPEVAGDSAILVDPFDVGAIRDGMKRLVSDTTLRQQLRHGGLLRAKDFSSDATGTKVRNALRLPPTQ